MCLIDLTTISDINIFSTLNKRKRTEGFVSKIVENELATIDYLHSHILQNFLLGWYLIQRVCIINETAKIVQVGE